MNVRIYSYQQNYTNENLNIFILIFLTRISIRFENCTNIRIYSNIRPGFTLKHTHQRMSEYIRTNKFDTNECLNIFVKEKLIQTNVRIYIRDQYIRIFEYIRHTLLSSLLVSKVLSQMSQTLLAQMQDEMSPPLVLSLSGTFVTSLL